MQDKSIDGALLALRKQMIRGKLDGIAHVETLLVMRGVDLPEVRIAKKADAARRGHMRRWVIEALKDGPQPRRVIAKHVASKRPELTAKQAHERLDQCLWKMKQAGLVVQDFGLEGCLWRIA